MRIEANSRKQVVGSMKKNAVVCELGVWKGRFARMIFDICKPRELHLVDCWTPQEKIVRREPLLNCPQWKYDEWMREAVGRFDEGDNVHFHKGMTSDVSERFEDQFFDWIYIDADHTYEGCSLDLSIYFPKVKKGGVIIADDYCEDGLNYYGVKRAVDEFCEHNGLEFDVVPKSVPNVDGLMEAVIYL